MQHGRNAVDGTNSSTSVNMNTSSRSLSTLVIFLPIIVLYLWEKYSLFVPIIPSTQLEMVGAACEVDTVARSTTTVLGLLIISTLSTIPKSSYLPLMKDNFNKKKIRSEGAVCVGGGLGGEDISSSSSSETT